MWGSMDADKVFQALGSATRRRLSGALRELKKTAEGGYHG